MMLRDILFLAFRSIRANKLRTGLTVSIIVLGITALVGIFTVIASIRASVYNNFASMGANGFTIRNWQMNVHFGNRGHATKGNMRDNQHKLQTSRRNLNISYLDAEAFKKRYQFPARVSVSLMATGTATVIRGNLKTNPNVQVIGGDENYLSLNGYDLESGRDFNRLDLESGRNVAILGHDVAQKLFGDRLGLAVDSFVKVGSIRYMVIGVLKSKGSSNMFSGDRAVITTLNNVRRVFQFSNPSFQVGVMVNQVQQLDAAIGEATGLFRIIRQLHPDEENNFYISKSDSLAEMLLGIMTKVRIAAIVIGFITLFGSAIGLMNIMLVAVAERTREIGVSKALGATSETIRRQFLYESLSISIMGGVLGILLGITVGNLFGLILGTSFVIPWGIIGIGIAICTVVGIVSGIYPAIKAAKLNPIIALRYE